MDWARGILSPDLLALLDDAELPFDLEIVEGWLFLYSPRQLAGGDPRVWRRTLGVVAAVHDAVEAADGGDGGGRHRACLTEWVPCDATNGERVSYAVPSLPLWRRSSLSSRT